MEVVQFYFRHRGSTAALPADDLAECVFQKSVLEDPGSVYFYSETFESIFKEGINSKCNSLLQKTLFAMKIGSNRDKLQILI